MEHHFSTMTMLMSISFLLVIGCAIKEPRVYPINGHTEVHRDHTILGLTYNTEVEKVRTYEQEKEHIRVAEAEAFSQIKIKRSQRQEAFAFWFGSLLLVGAGSCVIMGVLSKGYMFWGLMATTCGLLGSLAFGFAHWIPYLKWAPVPIVIAIVLWCLRCTKDWSLRDWWKRRKDHARS
jgi:hypothetical protein